MKMITLGDTAIRITQKRCKVMSIQEYLTRKRQAQGLTVRENEVLTYLTDTTPDFSGITEPLTAF